MVPEEWVDGEIRENYENKIKTQSNMCSLIGMRPKHELADVLWSREMEEEEKLHNKSMNKWMNEWIVLTWSANEMNFYW